MFISCRFNVRSILFFCEWADRLNPPFVNRVNGQRNAVFVWRENGILWQMTFVKFISEKFMNGKLEILVN